MSAKARFHAVVWVVLAGLGAVYAEPPPFGTYANVGGVAAGQEVRYGRWEEYYDGGDVLQPGNTLSAVSLGGQDAQGDPLPDGGLWELAGMVLDTATAPDGDGVARVTYAGGVLTLDSAVWGQPAGTSYHVDLTHSCATADIDGTPLDLDDVWLVHRQGDDLYRCPLLEVLSGEPCYQVRVLHRSEQVKEVWFGDHTGGDVLSASDADAAVRFTFDDGLLVEPLDAPGQWWCASDQWVHYGDEQVVRLTGFSYHFTDPPVTLADTPPNTRLLAMGAFAAHPGVDVIFSAPLTETGPLDATGEHPHGGHWGYADQLRVHVTPAPPAPDTCWQGAGGDWAEPANWTVGVPTLADAACIDNGETAAVTADAECNSLVVRSGGVNQTAGTHGIGGDLYLGYSCGGDGVYRLGGGALSVRDVYVGYAGVGRLELAGGTLDAATVNVADNGRVVTDSDWLLAGALNVVGGTVDVGGLGAKDGPANLTIDAAGDGAKLSILAGALTAHDEIVGAYNVGSVVHSGGVNTAAGEGEIVLGRESGASGTYELGGTGRLVAWGETVGCGGTGLFVHTAGANSTNWFRLGHDPGAVGTYQLSGTARLAAGDGYVGFGGTGTFAQTGGSHALTNLYLGHGAAADGRYELDATGQLLGGSEYVGFYGSGTFAQTGGTHSASTIYVGYFTGSTGTYQLGPAGQLSAIVEYVGNKGAGTFAQTGGTHTVGDLHLGNSPGASGRYELAGGELSVGGVYVGRAGTGTFAQTAGQGNVAYLLIGNGGRCELTGGTLLVNGLELEGSGELDFKDSAVALEWDDALVNFSAGSVLGGGNASLTLGGNTLIILRSGFDPAGVFGTYTTTGMTHTAGTELIVPPARGFAGCGQIDDHVRCEGTVAAAAGGGLSMTDGLEVLGAGSVDLGTGKLIVEDLVSGISGGELSGRYQRVGDSGTGRFVQSAGSNTAGYSLHMGYSAGSGGTYDLGGGDLSAGTEYVGGYGGYGAVNQTGGTHTVAGALYLAYSAGAQGTYDLSDGQLSANEEYLGVYGGSGAINQTGGTNTVGGGLYLGQSAGAVGTYNISAGSLSAADLVVGVDGSGRLRITGAAAEIAVSGLLRFGPDSVLTAVNGASIHMTGAALENENTDPADLVGLANLRLIFEGGGDAVDDVEVAGEDAGPAPTGWQGNFALGTLELGGAQAGHVRLVDLFDNQPDYKGPEALYVGTIVLHAGAWIDLNGLNLYYLNGGEPKQLFCGDVTLDGKVDYVDLGFLATHYDGTGKSWSQGDFTGEGRVDYVDLGILATYYDSVTGGAAPVPEPAVVGLFAAGMTCLLRRRRRARALRDG